ncbi:ComEC/Rec2 family competence protein [uncultured Subdoligranulum sp.]|uniref:ComEC/Rec2 family competence protein n=1 Tax=uncultured Subdoligranulum sp. TaxID=512298 RepID=UPI00260EDA93|nr:ComEC/Rec2 family competence protein [uncultured Subdoligranulum sp.]
MVQDILRKISGVVLAAALAISSVACASSPAPEPTLSPAVTAIPEEPNAAPTVDGAKDAPFSLTMLDVGQGLSVLVQAGGEYLLYDGGGRGASSYVVAYLQQHGVSELEWLVASHYDEDHISGLVGVLHTTPVEQALMPDYTTDTQIYQSLQNVLAEKVVPVISPTQGDTFSLGSAEIQIVGPKDYDYDSDNSNSLCLRIEYGDVRCLLTGDAEQDAEQDMVNSGQDLACDLYVVGHHGSSSSTSEELLKAASPAYAFLSVGEGNPYGHPTEQTMDALQQHGVDLYRTDKQGEVTVYSDGEKCWFSTSPCEDWTPGSQTTPDTPLATALPQSTRYVLNTHTKKFHYPDCSSVEQMSDKNKDFTDATREELIGCGYTPCGRCNP